MTTRERVPPAGRFAGGLAALDSAELRGLIECLQHSERDLQARVASRAATLDTVAGTPRSDPLYQRLFFALAGLREQLASANGELSRRTVARARPGTARGFSRMWKRMKADANEDGFEHRPHCGAMSAA